METEVSKNCLVPVQKNACLQSKALMRKWGKCFCWLSQSNRFVLRYSHWLLCVQSFLVIQRIACSLHYTRLLCVYSNHSQSHVILLKRRSQTGSDHNPNFLFLLLFHSFILYHGIFLTSHTKNEAIWFDFFLNF